MHLAAVSVIRLIVCVCVCVCVCVLERARKAMARSNQIACGEAYSDLAMH